MKFPHPFYHFRKEFMPRPKLVVPRGFNWPLFLVILLAGIWGVVLCVAFHALLSLRGH